MEAKCFEPQKFEPVFLEVSECRITEYGKRWLDDWNSGWERFNSTIRDVGKVALKELWKWPLVQRRLDLEGVPQMISSGISQGQMVALINASTKNTAYTNPTNFDMALMTTVPTSTTTGTLGANEASYTSYARAAVVMGAASSATPSVATNSSTVTFPNCTGGTSTLLGFVMVDTPVPNSGNALWFGTLTSTTINTTQTPPTVAAGALSLSMTGT